MKIALKCSTNLNIPYQKLLDFQGDLKELPEENYQRLKKEIATTGFAFAPHVWLNPSDKQYYLVNGHQRVKTVRRMAEEDKAECPALPCVQVEAASYQEAKRRVLQAASQYGKVSPEGLKHFLIDSKFQLADFSTSFSFPEIKMPSFIKEHFRTEAEKDEIADQTPPVPKSPKTKPGELYILGNHKLLCGDSTSEEQVAHLMGEEKIDLVITDPPYNVDYDPEARESYFSPERRANPLGTIENDKKSPEDFRKFLDAIYANINAFLKPGGALYIFHADTEGHHFRNAFIAQPWLLKSCLIWKKTVLVFGRSDYHWMHEPILYGWKTGGSHHWFGDRTQTTLLEFPTDHYNKKESDTAGYVHPTQKPVKLLETLMGNSSDQGQVILDLFGGSGSTIIAAEKAGRKARAMELDNHYCDVILDRWAKYTGKDPVREDGVSWSKIKHLKTVRKRPAEASK